MIGRVALSIFILVLTGSCKTLSNRIDTIKERCGDEVKPALFSYVRVLDENGDAVSLEDSRGLDIQLVDESGRSLARPSLTKRGCVELPKGSFQLSLASPARRQASSEKIDTKEEIFADFRLKKAAKVEAKLNCGKDGVFAHETLSSFFDLTVSGDPEGGKFRVLAISDSDKREFALFEKAQGERRLSIPSSFETKSLPEGNYHVELHYFDPLNGFGAAPIVLNQGKECRLSVLHVAPGIGERTRSLAYAKAGDIVPLQPEGAASQLFICTEERKGATGEGTCSPTGACADEQGYKELPYFTARQSGLYNLFAFAKDKAGNRSERICQPLSVSNEAPNVSVRWKKDYWNVPGAMMEVPFAVVKAQVDVQHAVLSPKALEESLECKVDFLVQGKNVISGSGVECMSGRCEGKRLGEYVPCGKELSLSLTRAWQQRDVRRSLMQLHVRASDKRGNIREAVRALWLNDSVWELEDIPYRNASGEAIEPDGNSFRLLANGQLVARFKDTIATLQGGSNWVPLPMPENNFELWKFGILDTEKSKLWATFQYPRAGQVLTEKHSAFAVFENGAWKIIKSDLTYLLGVLEPHYDGDGRLFFISDDQAFEFNGSTFEEIKIFDEYKSPECELDLSNKAAWQGNFVVICRDGILHTYRDGMWTTNTTWQVESDSRRRHQVLFDSSGKLWVLRYDYGNNTRVVGYFDKLEGKFTALPLPEGLPNSQIHLLNLAVGADGLAYLGQFFWDEKTVAWKRPFKDKFTAENSYRDFQATQSSNANFYSDENGSFLPYGNEYIYIPRPEKDTLGSGVTIAEIDPESRELYLSIYDRNSIVRLRRNRLSLQSYDFTGLLTAGAYFALEIENGFPVIGRRLFGLSRLTEQGWDHPWPIGSGNPDNNVQKSFHSKDGSYYLFDSGGIFQKKEGWEKSRKILDDKEEKGEGKNGIEVYEDNQSSLWFMDAWDREKGRVSNFFQGVLQHYDLPFSDRSPSCIFLMNDNVVVPLGNQFFKKPMGSEKFFPDEVLNFYISKSIDWKETFCSKLDSERIYFSGEDDNDKYRIVVYNKTTNELTKLRVPSEKFQRAPFSVARSTKGDWYAFDGYNIFKYIGSDKWQTEVTDEEILKKVSKVIPNGNFNRSPIIVMDSLDRLWIFTAGLLLRWDP